MELTLVDDNMKIKVGTWYPNTTKAYEGLGTEVTVLITSDGKLSEDRNMTTYVVFRKTEHMEKWDDNEQQPLDV